MNSTENFDATFRRCYESKKNMIQIIYERCDKLVIGLECCLKDIDLVTYNSSLIGLMTDIENEKLSRRNMCNLLLPIKVDDSSKLENIKLASYVRKSLVFTKFDEYGIISKNKISSAINDHEVASKTCSGSGSNKCSIVNSIPLNNSNNRSPPFNSSNNAFSAINTYNSTYSLIDSNILSNSNTPAELVCNESLNIENTGEFELMNQQINQQTIHDSPKIALFQFISMGPDYITLEIGDKVVIIEEYEDGWCKVDNNNNIGLVPRSYLS